MTGFEIAALAASLASTGVATGQAYAAAKTNEAISLANAKQVRSDARVEEGRVRRSNSRRLADARVKAGGSGFAIEGSVSDVLADMAAEAELEAYLPRTQGERQAQYHEMAAKNAKREATGALWKGGLQMAGSLATAGYDEWGTG